MKRTGVYVAARGLDDLIDYVRDIRVNGIPRAQRALDRALAETAEVSRGLAHVHRGALKESQRKGSDHGPAHWEGEISYSARGAHWEMEAGGDHESFISSLGPLSEEKFREALEEVFKRE